MNYELPSAPLPIGGVLDNAIRLYRHAIGRCWVLALIYSGLVGVFTLAWTLAAAKLAGPGGVANADPRLIGQLFSPATFGVSLLAIVVSTVFYGALVKTVIVLARGEQLSFGQATAAGLRRLPGIVLATFLFMLALLAGFILLLIPGIYILGKFQLFLVAMFAEDASATESLKISWRLTEKRWWRAFVIFSVAIVLIYVVAFAFGIVAGALGALLHLGSSVRVVVGQLFSVLSNVIVMPLSVAISVAMYHDFKLRSEGGDLAARVGSLGKA